jgi:hypothetical protein
MDNIQLATTLVAPTGTGVLFKPFSSDANTAVFKDDSSNALLSFKRTLPKSNGSNQGVERFEVKLTSFHVVGDDTHAVILTLTGSIPVPVIDADRVLMTTRLALVSRDPAVLALIENGRIPL